MATITQTKKQIEKALKQLSAIPNLEGRITLMYDLPEGETMKQRLENFEKILASIECSGLERENHVFFNNTIEIHLCTK